MPIDLDALEQRVVGVLIEKELTVPDTYPLTVNALMAGCNQKSNRDPFMTVEDFDIEGALRALMDKGWVTRREAHGGRAMRYAHEVRDQLGVQEPALAILSELLCRGPQAPGELKTRASRMHPFAGPGEVEDVLSDLAARPVPYVAQLARRPRERYARWAHRLGRAIDAPAPDADPRQDDPAPRARPESPAALTSAPPPPTPAGPDPEGLEALERRVADLEERLDRLEGR